MRSSSHFISIHKTLPSTVNTASSHIQSIPGHTMTCTPPTSPSAQQPAQVHPVHVHVHAIHFYNDY